MSDTTCRCDGLNTVTVTVTTSLSVEFPIQYVPTDAGFIRVHHASMAEDSMLLEIRDEMRRMREDVSALVAQQKQVADQQEHLLARLDALSSASISAAATKSPPPPRSIQHSSSIRLSSSNAGTRDPFFGASLKRVHPMFVIPVSTILAPSFLHFRSHEELKGAGHLVEYQDWMEESVLFVSHTWLRQQHPDNERGVKFALLRAVLQRAVEGTLDIGPHWFTGLVFKKAGFPFRLRAADMQRNLANGYVFMDYMSIPQADPEAQKRAIASLVSYVSASAYFMCLAGPWTHEDGSPRDDMAWSGRGWCRMEMTANALSPSTKPIILACSPTRIVTIGPGGHIGREWLVSARVGHGAFSVDSDKAALAPYLQRLIIARKALALSDGDMVLYRTLHAAASWLLDGCEVAEPEAEPYEAWMASMRFETAKDTPRNGLTPLHFACMTGRADLVEALLDRGAAVGSAVKSNEPKVSIMKLATPLSLAVSYARDANIIELLLSHGADPLQAVTFTGSTCVHFAMLSENMVALRALMRHDASLIRAQNRMNIGPIALGTMTARLHFYTMLSKEFPDEVLAAFHGHDPNAGMSLMSNAIVNGSATVGILEMILDAGVPVDQCGQGKGVGPMKKVLRMAKMISWLRPMGRMPEFAFVFAYLVYMPALSCAAYFGMLTIVDLFLERGADVNHTANKYGLAPLHLAAIGGHDDVCARLLDQGAAPGAKDKRGRTALTYATRLGHDTVRRRLTAAGRGGAAPAVTLAAAAKLSTNDRVLPFGTTYSE